MKYLFITVCILLCQAAHAQTSQPDAASVIDKPEERAYFPFGQDSLNHFIKKNLHFRTAKDEATGKAVVIFIIETNGTIANAEIISTSGDQEFDKEAVRVVKTISGWKPAKNKGKTVRSTDMLSVSYQSR